MSGLQLDITRTHFPCKDCKDRHTGCHSECPKYIKAKEDHDEKKEKIKEAIARENIVWGFKKKAITAMIKNSGRKWR